MGTFVGKLAVFLDMAARCAVGVVSVLLIRELWGEPESNSDGPPVQLFIPPLIAYIGWNIWVVTRSSRRWISGALGDSSFLASLGLVSLLRLVWLLPLADDWWWRYRQRLMVLIVMSVVTALLALAAAIRLATASASPVEDDARSDDQNDPLGSSPKHAEPAQRAVRRLPRPATVGDRDTERLRPSEPSADVPICSLGLVVGVADMRCVRQPATDRTAATPTVATPPMSTATTVRSSKHPPRQHPSSKQPAPSFGRTFSSSASTSRRICSRFS